MEPNQEENGGAGTDPLLEEQEGKGYGAEEGEREPAIDESPPEDDA
jgi:hypothetical protein